MLQLAGCVITDDKQRILLLHRDKNGLVHWELPGGKVDDGEDEAITAEREMREELGVTAKIQQKLGSTEFTAPDGTVCQYAWFKADIIGDNEPYVREPETHDAVCYFRVDELDALTLSANMINLHDALKSGSIRLS